MKNSKIMKLALAGAVLVFAGAAAFMLVAQNANDEPVVEEVAIGEATDTAVFEKSGAKVTAPGDYFFDTSIKGADGTTYIYKRVDIEDMSIPLVLRVTEFDKDLSTIIAERSKLTGSDINAQSYADSIVAEGEGRVDYQDFSGSVEETDFGYIADIRYQSTLSSATQYEHMVYLLVSDTNTQYRIFTNGADALKDSVYIDEIVTAIARQE